MGSTTPPRRRQQSDRSALADDTLSRLVTNKFRKMCTRGLSSSVESRVSTQHPMEESARLRLNPGVGSSRSWFDRSLEIFFQRLGARTENEREA